MKAAKKGSLATEEGGPRVQVESGNNKGAFEDRCLINDDFEKECGSSVDHQVVSHQEFIKMFEERSEESGFEVGHVVVIVPPHFDHSQQKTIRRAGAITGIHMCRISSEPKPATKPRGFQGGCPVEAEPSLQGEPCRGMSEPVPEPMLRASYYLLQMAHLLLQSGQQAKEVESKGAKKKVNRINVTCQTAHDEEKPEEPA